MVLGDSLTARKGHFYRSWYGPVEGKFTWSFTKIFDPVRVGPIFTHSILVGADPRFLNFSGSGRVQSKEIDKRPVTVRRELKHLILRHLVPILPKKRKS